MVLEKKNLFYYYYVTSKIMFLKGGGAKVKRNYFLSNFNFKNFPIYEPKRNFVLQRNCLLSIDLKVGWVQVIIH